MNNTVISDTTAPIVLMTDFGLQDPYVGQMKGVLCEKIPGVRIVDLTHEILPHRIEQAGFFLKASHAYFPPQTIFVAVVDPGVGTSREIILLEHANQFFLAPNNGLLSFLTTGPSGIWEIHGLDTGLPVSNTFHGRDIFVPLAAELAKGKKSSDLGRPLRSGRFVIKKWSEPEYDGEILSSHVVHIDRFGNIITNVSINQWAHVFSREYECELFEPVASPLALCSSYDQIPAGHLGLIAGSQGYFELALSRASAAQKLEAGLGQLLRIRISS